MKILISGTINSGKTTLFNELKTLYSSNTNIGFLSELASEMIFKFPQIRELYEFEYYLIIQQIIREKKLLENNDIIICDRGVFEPIVYCDLMGKKYSHNILTIMEHVDYDVTLFCDYKDIDHQRSKLKVENIEFREKLNNKLLKRYKGKNITFISGDFENRVNTTKGIIDVAIDVSD